MSKPEESRFVPYEAVRHFGVERVLVFAPHADDEVFGCGGALALHAREGADVQVIVLTDGRANDPAAGEEVPGIREAESLAAAHVLGYAAPTFWRLPDRGLQYDEVLVSRIGEALATWQPQTVYAPAPSEVHPDHRACALAVLEAVRRYEGETGLSLYEVGVPIPHPDSLVDIGPVLELKRKAMRCFSSQLAIQAYDEHIEALNRYRTYTLGRGVTAAEAFRKSSSSTLRTQADELLQARTWDALLPAADGEVPLVSVMVRSMDRTSLRETLDSVAAQTHARIEIVVVNARGGMHTPLPGQWGRPALRLVNENGPALNRGKAANHALTASRGRFLMFLDDDDSIDPDHVAKLVNCLQDNPGAVAAHTGVDAVDRDGRLLLRFCMNAPAARLRLGNFLPIHAVLFRATAVTEHGCAVDESLEIYEDWDFWLQLERLGSFVHVPGVSARYLIGEPTQHPVHAPQMKLKWRTRILQKWGCSFDPKAFDLLAGHVENSESEVRTLNARIVALESAQAELVARMGEVNRQNDDLRRTLEIREQTLLEQQASIAALQHSLSWKITAPLRKMLSFMRFGSR